jgi:hypothetical protein
MLGLGLLYDRRARSCQMMKREGIWSLVFRAAVFWLALLVVVNLGMFLITGYAIPWYLLPLMALFVALAMMAVT